MNTTDYGNRIIVTRTSRNGRRLSFQAFESLDELAAAIINAIDLDFDPDWRGSADTIGAEKNRAMQHMHQYHRYIGYGGQWIWERVTSDDQLTFWETVRGPQDRGRKSGWYLCTPVPSRWLGLDDYQAAIEHKPLAPEVLQQLPPRARFLTELMVQLWTRIHADDETHFNGWLTRSEASELQRLDLYQPGHSQHRYSVPNEDLSDYAQRDTLRSSLFDSNSDNAERTYTDRYGNTHNLKPGDTVMITSPVTRTPYVVTVAALDSPNRHCFTTTTGLSVSYRRVVKAVEASESPETNGGEQ